MSQPEPILPPPSGRTYPIPTKPLRRPRSCKSYDKKGGRTPGWLYAHHDPETHILLDFCEFTRQLRLIRGDAVTRAIVLSYLDRYPHQPFPNRRYPRSFETPTWDRLSQPAHWYFYNTALSVGDFPRLHAVTVNLSDERVQTAFMRGIGPARIIGTEIINKRLSHIYRRTGIPLHYAYCLEHHFKPNEDTQRTTRSTLDSFDATLLVQVPEELCKKVEKALAKWAGRSVERIKQRHAGSPVFIQRVCDWRSFSKGPDHTFRFGVEGKGDYAAKTLSKLSCFQEFCEEIDAPFARALTRLCSASEQVKAEARLQYEGIRKFAESSWADVADDLRTGARPISNGKIAAKEPLRRIAESDPLLKELLAEFLDEEAVRRHLSKLPGA